MCKIQWGSRVKENKIFVGGLGDTRFSGPRPLSVVIIILVFYRPTNNNAPIITKYRTVARPQCTRVIIILLSETMVFSSYTLYISRAYLPYIMF